eukprot:PhF_6_TR4248/c0_g1_i1/m.5745/K07119/K07119; uncharacterized protein
MKVGSPLPKSFRKIVVNKLSTDFRACTEIVTTPMPTALRPGRILVRNYVVGINASDINYTAGVYKPGVKPPFDCGFEALGVVVATADDVKQINIGDAVVSMTYSAFSEYQELPVFSAVKVPSMKKEYITLMSSAMTASLALESIGKIQPGSNVLVTAAAGGTGQFAVQLAKHVYNCKVFGTCSSDDKSQFLRSLGCDRPINYKKENLGEVLKKEAPNGIHVVYESVGGDMLETALDSLAVRGRLIVIGSITGYQGGNWQSKPYTTKKPIHATLLSKSASMVGFFLPHYNKHIPRHMALCLKLMDEGKLQVMCDPQPFFGLEDVASAVEYLHKGMNSGKVVVDLVKPQAKVSKL